MLKLNHLIQDFLNDTKNQIIQEGDFIEFTPIRGKKRVFPLNRSNYEIRMVSDLFEIKKEGNIISVPSCQGEEGTIFLELHENIPFDAYFVRAHLDDFFIYNGRVTNFSFIRNGDDINLGFNLLKFKKLEKTSDNFKHLFSEFDPKNTDLSILIQGETGTGKTTLAKKIHEHSCVYGEFVHLNLSAFSNGLIESELFGHSKGAFTGAVFEKRGAILEANNGTLFLDEIDSISRDLQTKLLTFLDNGVFRQVGGSEKRSNVRLIYSTGRDLRDLVSSGEMRADFFYRISSGYFISLPNLRDSKDYCKFQIDSLLEELNCSISHELLNWYLECPWYGNLRQLKFHLKKKLLKNKSAYLRFDQEDFNLKNDFRVTQKIFENQNIIKLVDLKKQYIKQMLQINSGNYKITSKQIGVSENTVRRCV